jgi:hypothetical protein
MIASVSKGQDLKQLAPVVGTVFQYAHEARMRNWYGGAGGVCEWIISDSIDAQDTVVMSVLSVNVVPGDSVLWIAFDRGSDTAHCSIHQTRDSISKHPFRIDDPFIGSFDASKSFDATIEFNTRNITLWRSSKQDRVSILIDPPSSPSGSLSYFSFSPDLGWYYEGSQFDGAWTLPAPGKGPQKLDGHSCRENRYRLLFAETPMKRVEIEQLSKERVWFDGFNLIAQGFQNIKTLKILDPLGRPVRSWQLAASDGPREITLNVADVPSGVYFLRLQGGGVDEVRKVLIR